MDGLAYVNGRYAPLAEATVSVMDWGFRRSDVVYDVVSVGDGAFFHLDAHLDRFAASMRKFRMELPETMEDIRGIVHGLVSQSGLRSAAVTVDCIRGQPEPGAPNHPAFAPCYLIGYVKPYYKIVPDAVMTRGAHMTISAIPRIPAVCVDPTAKNFHRADMTQASFESRARGFDHPILLDLEGNVTEGPGFNVFAVIDGVVVTPDANVLEGITRKAVIELCEKLGMRCEVRKLSLAELREADEIFLSSTAGGVIGVTRLDTRILGNDRAGAVTQTLGEEYWGRRRQGWHAEAVEYAH